MKYSKLFPYLIICLIILILYLPSFSGSFLLDDHPIVVNNLFYKEWHPFSDYMFQEDGYDKDKGIHTGYYRPLVGITYTLDHKIWGLSGPGYRITNLILHLLTCFAILSLFNLIISKRIWSFILTLIFSLHPANTEAVSWVAARNNILATLFGIITLCYYIKAYKNKSFYAYIMSIIFFTLSIFSKEIGLMLIPIFFIHQRFLSHKKDSILTELKEYLPYILIGFFYFVLRQVTTGSLLTPLENANIFTRVVNLPYVLFYNLRIIFFPFQLHSFIIHYPEKMIDFITILSIVLFVIFAYIVWKYLKNRVMLFSIFAFLCAIFPTSGLINFPSPTLIAMRWLYFPLPFLLLLLIYPFEIFIKINRKLSIIIFTSISIYLGINSYMLNNFLWNSSDIFFTQEVLQFNNMFYADGYALIKHKENKLSLAKMYFEKNFNSGVNRAVNYLLYSEILQKEGNIEKSLEYLDKATYYCATDEEWGTLFYIKGLVYLKKNEFEFAIQNFQKAIIFEPKKSLYWENLGVTYGKMKNHEAAIFSFKKAMRMLPATNSVYKNLTFAYIANKECHKAKNLAEGILKGYMDNYINRLLRDVDECLKKSTGVLEKTHVEQ